jgi:uncharacterized protein (TIGR03437 family)
MRCKLGVLAGFVLVFSVGASAQDGDASAAPKVANPWFLLTGPKEVTLTKATSTPHFNQTITITDTPPNGTFNVPYSFQFTATGGTAPYNWSWFPFNGTNGGIPPRLNLTNSGANAGAVSGTPIQAGTFVVSVNVNDGNNGDFGGSNFTIVINLNVTGSPQSGLVGIKYPGAQFSASGGSGSYTFVATGLPSGMILSTGGALSGTPTQAGTFPLTITATDTQNATLTGTENVTLTINTCTPTFLTPAGLVSGDIGSPYSQAIIVSGCMLPYTFAVSPSSSGSTSTLPPGLTLSQPATGSTSAVISGTPTSAAGSPYTFNVTVTEANKGTATQTFSIGINPQLVLAATSPLPAATVGQLYSQSLMPTGGTPPYSSVSLDVPPPGMTLDSPSGLLHGTPPASAASATPYTFTATLIDNLAAEVQKTFQLLIMSGQPSIQLSPTTLNFTAAVGGPPPASQAVSIAAAPSTSGAKYSVSIDGGQQGTNAPFTLSATPGSGNAPSQLLVNVDQGSLQPGNTSGRIRVFDQNKVETDVAVNLTVTQATAQVQMAPMKLRFAATMQSPGTFEQDLAVTTAGGNPAGFSASVVNGSSWLSIVGASGQTVRNSAVFVRVIVNSQGQSVGSHSDTIHFTYPGGTADVPVYLFVRNSGSVLGANVTGLRYRARQGGGFTGNEAVQVLDLGDPNTTVNWTAQVVSGANLVSLGVTSGTATPTQPASLPINLAAGATQQNPGGYYALISITDPNSSNSPVYIVVVLDLASSNAPPVPDPEPTGLFFAVAAGGAQSPAQTVALNTSSATPVAFQVAAFTADGGNWLVVNPASGQSSGSAPGSFTVAVNPAGLSPGVYSGSVSISIGAVVAAIDITVVVLPAGSVIPSSSEVPRDSPRATSCTPSKLAMTEIGVANNFSVPAKWPATLIVHLNDDCANSVTNGAVVASFSNGDPPLSLRNTGQGANYSATWQPGTTTSQMVVSLNATAATLAPATLQLVGGVAANQNAAPVLANGGTVNAFNPVSGGALSPGTIVEMFGTGLSSATTATGAPPLPISFSGTTVLIAGLSAPLYYVSDGQLNVQIPSELPANQQYPILVTVNGAVTLPDQLDMVTLQPGVDASTTGTIVAQHGADFSLVTSGSPAKPGETIVVYLLGMGATNPAVASGQPAPSNPLAMVTSQPTITVGGQSAHVDFAGLTPGFAGLYQVDFDVPTTASTGNLPVVISQNGVVTNNTTLPVSK